MTRRVHPGPFLDDGWCCKRVAQAQDMDGDNPLLPGAGSREGGTQQAGLGCKGRVRDIHTQGNVFFAAARSRMSGPSAPASNANGIM